jgi:hypothetical protein
MAARTATKQRGRPFEAGTSGNPSGRPKGSRNKATLAAEALLDGQAEALTQKAVEMALAGDTTALRLCLERTVPPRRERAITFEMPPIRGADDASAAVAGLIAAVAAGQIVPGEAESLARLVTAYVGAIEASEFDQRLKALEAKADQR